VAEPSGNPPSPAHAARMHALTSDKIDAPAACATLSATGPFHFAHSARVLQREREMLASTRSMPSFNLVTFIDVTRQLAKYEE